jgi:hypothetical protein
MKEDTGEIREEKDIPEKEKKGWVGIVPAMVEALSSLTPRERVEQLQLERSSGKPHYFTKPTLAGPGAREKRNKKYKAQKLSRRRNRK